MRKSLILLTSLMLITSCSDNDDVVDVVNSNAKTNRADVGVTSKSELEMNGAPIAPWVAFNGDFAKVVDNGHVLYYVKFTGKWRHIDNIATWDGLFINKAFKYDRPSIKSLADYTQTGIGSPIFIDNGLLQNPNNGRIYFREGNTLKWIPSMQLFEQYHFNPNAVVQSTETENPLKYTQLPDLSNDLY